MTDAANLPRSGPLTRNDGSEQAPDIGSALASTLEKQLGDSLMRSQRRPQLSSRRRMNLTGAEGGQAALLGTASRITRPAT